MGALTSSSISGVFGSDAQTPAAGPVPAKLKTLKTTNDYRVALKDLAGGDEKETEPKLGKARVDQLVEQLGDDTFSVRQTADATLGIHMDLPTLHIVARARNHKDLEIAKRARRLVREHALTVMQTMKTTKFPDVWINTAQMHSMRLPESFPLREMEPYQLLNEYILLARKAGAPDDQNPRWSDWTMAAELFLRDIEVYHGIDAVGDPRFNDRRKETVTMLREIHKEWQEQDRNYRRLHNLPERLHMPAPEPVRRKDGKL